MSLLDDFKIAIGVTGTSNDQFYTTYFLKPAIDQASKHLVNVKETEITLTPGTQTYDLTSGSVASPVVGTSGIYELIYDAAFPSYLFIYYKYKQEFYIKNRKTLFFTDLDFNLSGTHKVQYRAYYTTPTVSPAYVETDLPNDIFPAIIKYASADYELQNIGSSNNNLGVERKSEGNQMVSYGSISSQLDALNMRKNEAIKMFKEYGAQQGNASFNLFHIQHI